MVHLPTAFRSARLRAALSLGSAALALAACSTLPASGPTAGQIKRGATSDNPIGFRIVEIDSAVLAETAARDQAADAAVPTLSSLAEVGRNDTVGPGDVLTVSIYEVGVTLFGGGRNGGGEMFDPSARGETFPTVVVETDGTITLPYVGRLAVAGRTTGEIQTLIERGLRGKSQNPQALVAIRQNVSNTVFVAGDVRKPGRLDLTLQRERLLDAIAAAGGAANSAEDTIVRFNRGNRTLEERLGRIRSGAPDDLVLRPGDRIELIKRPRTFIVFGATTRVNQVPFETGDVTLAEAVARAGGPSDATADPSAVFLFRYAPAEPGGAEVPTVYRLNMMRPVSYLLSQRFPVRDKDVIYIGNAPANQPAKLVNIINQLFSPFLTARILTDNNR